MKFSILAYPDLCIENTPVHNYGTRNSNNVKIKDHVIVVTRPKNKTSDI